MDLLRQRLWQCVEPLLLVLVVYAPWAINSEPLWCYRGLLVLAGACTVAALFGKPPGPANHEAYRLTPPLKCLLVLGLVFLAYVFISAVNGRARAVVGSAGVGLEYREVIEWLPHSYSLTNTWNGWFKQLAVAGVAWATWRWMAAQVVVESFRRRNGAWPPGVKRLMRVVGVSSSIMAVEAILQRLSKTDNLLFFYPRYTWNGVLNGKDSLGPFAYQGSGSAYFNMIWPLVIGFWWVQRQREWERTGTSPRFGSSIDSILPVGAALMAACPLISTSRTGAAVCLIQLGFFVCACLIQWRRLPKTLRWGALAGILLLGSFVASVGWEPLLKKARQAQQDRWGMRLQIYEQTRRMIPDFDPWGGGAESFRKLSHLYTDPTASNWESFVHNEWLEARLSYGWVGYGILWGMILSWLVALRWRSSRTLPSSFSPFLGVSIGGFLIDARFDIPFQTLSLHLLFTLLVVIALYSGTPKAQASPVGLRS